MIKIEQGTSGSIARKIEMTTTQTLEMMISAKAEFSLRFFL